MKQLETNVSNCITKLDDEQPWSLYNGKYIFLFINQDDNSSYLLVGIWRCQKNVTHNNDTQMESYCSIIVFVFLSHGK